MTIELLHCDCMTYMATLPDKAFDLAIVDPPYGIGMGGAKLETLKLTISNLLEVTKQFQKMSIFMNLNELVKI